MNTHELKHMARVSEWKKKVGSVKNFSQISLQALA